MLITVFALLTALSATASESALQMGEDEVGRPCAMRMTPKLEVQIENQWYGRPTNSAFTPASDDPAAAHPRTRTGRLTATLHARDDDTPGEFELELRHGIGAYFTLALPSATGYAHGCRFASSEPDHAL